MYVSVAQWVRRRFKTIFHFSALATFGNALAKQTCGVRELHLCSCHMSAKVRILHLSCSPDFQGVNYVANGLFRQQLNKQSLTRLGLANNSLREDASVSLIDLLIDCLIN